MVIIDKTMTLLNKNTMESIMKTSLWKLLTPTPKLLKKTLSAGIATSMMIACVSIPTSQKTSDNTKSTMSYPSLRAMGLQPILLRFQANVGNERFSCRRSFANVGNSSDFIRFTDLRMYVSEIKMVRKDGTTVPVALIQDSWQSGNVALLDFEDKTGACIEDGTKTRRTYIIGAVPFGEYEGVKFRVGVPSYYRLPGMPFIPSSGKRIVKENEKLAPTAIKGIKTVSRISDSETPFIKLSSPDRVRGGEVKKRSTINTALSSLEKDNIKQTALSLDKENIISSDKIALKDTEERNKTKGNSPKEDTTKYEENRGPKILATIKQKDMTSDEELAQETTLSKQDEMDMERAEKDIPFGVSIVDDKTVTDMAVITEAMPTKKDFLTYPSKNMSPMSIAIVPTLSDTDIKDYPSVNTDRLTYNNSPYAPQPESYRVGKVIAQLPELDKRYAPTNPREDAMIRADLGSDMFRLVGTDGRTLAFTDTNMPFVLRADNHLKKNTSAASLAGTALGAATGSAITGAALGALYGVGVSRFEWYPTSREDLAGMTVKSGTYPPAPMNIPTLYAKTGSGYAHMRIGMRSTNMSQRKLSSELSFRLGQGLCEYNKDTSLSCERDNRPLVEFDNFDYRRNTIHLDVLSLMYSTIIPAQNKPLEQNCNAEDNDGNCNYLFLNLGLDISTGEPLTNFRQDVFSFR